jgi:hypothetical protein
LGGVHPQGCGVAPGEAGASLKEAESKAFFKKIPQIIINFITISILFAILYQLSQLLA